MISNNGVSIFGSTFSYVADFQPESNVSSFTFTNTPQTEMDSDIQNVWAMSISWLNPLVGAVKLIMRPNGVAIPAESGSQRDGFNVNTKVREDDSFTDLVIAELQAGQANTWVIGSMFFHLNPLAPARMFTARGIQYDKTATVVNRRVTDRIGLYNDTTTRLTSLQILTDTGTAAIGAGSRFFLYRV